MEISTPDPYPGRCKNRRTEGFATARCIDYEGTEHVCSFPDLQSWSATPEQIRSWSGASIIASDPVPWVKPGVRDD